MSDTEQQLLQLLGSLQDSMIALLRAKDRCTDLATKSSPGFKHGLLDESTADELNDAAQLVESYQAALKIEHTSRKSVLLQLKALLNQQEDEKFQNDDRMRMCTAQHRRLQKKIAILDGAPPARGVPSEAPHLGGSYERISTFGSMHDALVPAGDAVLPRRLSQLTAGSSPAGGALMANSLSSTQGQLAEEHAYSIGSENEVYCNSFRNNIQDFLKVFGKRVSLPGLKKVSAWIVPLTNPLDTVFLHVYEEKLSEASNTVCDQCRCMGWQHHPVCTKKYHFIVPNPLYLQDMSHVTAVVEARLRGKGKELKFTWNGPEDDEQVPFTAPTTCFDSKAHLLHGVVHINGYGHLMRMNGREGGSMKLHGKHLMTIWDNLCTVLRVREVSTEDVSNKSDMLLRVLHPAAFQRTWYGKWGYEFGRGGFNLKRTDWWVAVKYVSDAPISALQQDYDAVDKNIGQILQRYSQLGDKPATTLGGVLQKMLKLLSAAPPPPLPKSLPPIPPPPVISKAPDPSNGDPPPLPPRREPTVYLPPAPKKKATSSSSKSSAPTPMQDRYPVDALPMQDKLGMFEIGSLYRSVRKSDTSRSKVDRVVTLTLEALQNLGKESWVSRQTLRSIVYKQFSDGAIVDAVLKAIGNTLVRFEGGEYRVYRSLGPQKRSNFYHIEVEGAPGPLATRGGLDGDLGDDTPMHDPLSPTAAADAGAQDMSATHTLEGASPAHEGVPAADEPESAPREPIPALRPGPQAAGQNDGFRQSVQQTQSTRVTHAEQRNDALRGAHAEQRNEAFRAMHAEQRNHILEDSDKAVRPGSLPTSHDGITAGSTTAAQYQLHDAAVPQPEQRQTTTCVLPHVHPHEAAAAVHSPPPWQPHAAVHVQPAGTGQLSAPAAGMPPTAAALPAATQWDQSIGKASASAGTDTLMTSSLGLPPIRTSTSHPASRTSMHTVAPNYTAIGSNQVVGQAPQSINSALTVSHLAPTPVEVTAPAAGFETAGNPSGHSLLCHTSSAGGIGEREDTPKGGLTPSHRLRSATSGLTAADVDAVLQVDLQDIAVQPVVPVMPVSHQPAVLGHKRPRSDDMDEGPVGAVKSEPGSEVATQSSAGLGATRMDAAGLGKDTAMSVNEPTDDSSAMTKFSASAVSSLPPRKRSKALLAAENQLTANESDTPRSRALSHPTSSSATAINVTTSLQQPAAPELRPSTSDACITDTAYQPGPPTSTSHASQPPPHPSSSIPDPSHTAPTTHQTDPPTSISHASQPPNHPTPSISDPPYTVATTYQADPPAHAPHSNPASSQVFDPLDTNTTTATPQAWVHGYPRNAATHSAIFSASGQVGVSAQGRNEPASHAQAPPSLYVASIPGESHKREEPADAGAGTNMTVNDTKPTKKPSIESRIPVNQGDNDANSAEREKVPSPASLHAGVNPMGTERVQCMPSTPALHPDIKQESPPCPSTPQTTGQGAVPGAVQEAVQGAVQAASADEAADVICPKQEDAATTLKSMTALSSSPTSMPTLQIAELTMPNYNSSTEPHTLPPKPDPTKSHPDDATIPPRARSGDPPASHPIQQATLPQPSHQASQPFTHPDSQPRNQPISQPNSHPPVHGSYPGSYPSSHTSQPPTLHPNSTPPRGPDTHDGHRTNHCTDAGSPQSGSPATQAALSALFSLANAAEALPTSPPPAFNPRDTNNITTNVVPGNGTSPGANSHPFPTPGTWPGETGPGQVQDTAASLVKDANGGYLNLVSEQRLDVMVNEAASSMGPSSYLPGGLELPMSLLTRSKSTGGATSESTRGQEEEVTAQAEGQHVQGQSQYAQTHQQQGQSQLPQSHQPQYQSQQPQPPHPHQPQCQSPPSQPPHPHQPQYQSQQSQPPHPHQPQYQSQPSQPPHPQQPQYQSQQSQPPHPHPHQPQYQSQQSQPPHPHPHQPQYQSQQSQPLHPHQPQYQSQQSHTPQLHQQQGQSNHTQPPPPHTQSYPSQSPQPPPPHQQSHPSQHPPPPPPHPQSQPSQHPPPPPPPPQSYPSQTPPPPPSHQHQQQSQPQPHQQPYPPHHIQHPLHQYHSQYPPPTPQSHQPQHPPPINSQLPPAQPQQPPTCLRPLQTPSQPQQPHQQTPQTDSRAQQQPKAHLLQLTAHMPPPGPSTPAAPAAAGSLLPIGHITQLKPQSSSAAPLHNPAAPALPSPAGHPPHVRPSTSPKPKTEDIPEVPYAQVLKDLQYLYRKLLTSHPRHPSNQAPGTPGHPDDPYTQANKRPRHLPRTNNSYSSASSDPNNWTSKGDIPAHSPSLPLAAHGLCLPQFAAMIQKLKDAKHYLKDYKGEYLGEEDRGAVSAVAGLKGGEPEGGPSGLLTAGGGSGSSPEPGMNGVKTDTRLIRLLVQVEIRGPQKVATASLRQPAKPSYALTPTELLLVTERTTLGDLKRLVLEAFSCMYRTFRDFNIDAIKGVDVRNDKDRLGPLPDYTTLTVSTSGFDPDPRWQHAGGVEDWVVHCTCGTVDDDGERMICCDTCEVWMHTRCCGIPDDCPEPASFVCPECTAEVEENNKRGGYSRGRTARPRYRIPNSPE